MKRILAAVFGKGGQVPLRQEFGRGVQLFAFAMLLLCSGCRHRTSNYDAPVAPPGGSPKAKPSSAAPEVAATPTTVALPAGTTADTSPQGVKLMKEANVKFGIPHGFKFEDAPDGTLRYFGPRTSVIIFARLGGSNDTEAELSTLTAPWLKEGFSPRTPAKKDDLDGYPRVTLDLVKGNKWSHFVAVSNGHKTLLVWLRGDLAKYPTSVESLDASFQKGPATLAAPSPSAAAASPSAAAASPSTAASPTGAANP